MHVKLEDAYSRPPNKGFWRMLPPKWGAVWTRPQNAHPWAKTRRMTYRSSKSVHFCGLSTSRRIKEKIKKLQKVHLRNHNRCFIHVFAQTTHVVTAPHGFACAGISATWLYIPSVIEIRSGVSEPQGVKIWPFPLLWLLAFITACTTVQAVIS